MEGFFGLDWLVWAGVCLAVALLLAMFYPRIARERAGLDGAILRWGQPVAWVLLAASFVVRRNAGSTTAASILAIGTALVYLVFLMTLARARRG